MVILRLQRRSGRAQALRLSVSAKVYLAAKVERGESVAFYRPASEGEMAEKPWRWVFFVISVEGRRMTNLRRG